MNGQLELMLVSSEQWEGARHRLAIIQPLAQKARRTRADVAAAAEQLGLRIAQLYRLLSRYVADPRLTTLVPQPGGGVRGRSRLSAEVEILVDSAIETMYLTRQRSKISDLHIEIRRRCHQLNLILPSRKAVTARVRSRPQREIVARREGGKAARDRFAPVTGSLEAGWPLSLVQIDHTLVDVIVVDSVTRLPIQRPWITLAIDVYSRCVVGMHLSLEPPSATSVALCIAQAALPKQPWLAQRKVEEEWAVEGIMARLHLDNAKEFRSEALRRGCEQYGISIDYRPVRTPHYGGHIERLIGTMMGQVHLLPGTTFSDIRIKGGLDPEKLAVMSIDEVERWLAHQIAGVYHRKEHSSLNVPPLVKWERGISGDGATLGCGEPTPVTDARRFLIDFLPIERRLIRRDGISLCKIQYWSDVLRTWIGESERMIVRYDPRDLSRIYLLAPDGQYYDLHYRDLRRAPITLWEHRLALKRLREEGNSHVDEAAIFRTIEKMRAIVDEATLATKTARRQRERRLRLIPGGRVDSAPDASAAVQAAPVDEDNNQSTVQPWENMLPVEEW
jgi:putative transposase